MTVKVIGVGNRFRRDDGIGPAAVDLLRGVLPAHIRAETRRCDPADLIAAWRGAAAAVIIDAAAPAGNPGRIVRIDMNETAPAPRAAASTHGFGLAEALALARALAAAPQNVIVYAMEGEDFGHGDGLSAAVHARLPALVARVRAQAMAAAAAERQEIKERSA